MIYEKLQKKWSFEFKISINYKLVFWSIISCYPRLAQLVEHQTSNQEVMSSSLAWGSFLFYARLYTVIVHCASLSQAEPSWTGGRSIDITRIYGHLSRQICSTFEYGEDLDLVVIYTMMFRITNDIIWEPFGKF